MSYVERVNALLPRVSERLASKLESMGLKSGLVDFEIPHKRPRTRPGAARSEFLANRAMGDWAEDSLARELQHALTGYRVLRYGNADRIVAGDPEFPAFFERYHVELGDVGKRPDLLVCGSAVAGPDTPDDIAGAESEVLAQLVCSSAAGIEVRSSKYFALKYAEKRSEQRRSGQRAVQSFTPKIEDLRLIVRWIRRYGVPHFYAQVFFDVVYMISSEKILVILSDGAGQFTVEKNRNNQDKPTIHLPVTSGTEIGRFVHPPDFDAKTRETADGRLDAFVAPRGGTLVLDPEAVRETLGIVLPPL